jgi:hypothetical protein
VFANVQTPGIGTATWSTEPTRGGEPMPRGGVWTIVGVLLAIVLLIYIINVL